MTIPVHDSREKQEGRKLGNQEATLQSICNKVSYSATMIEPACSGPTWLNIQKSLI
jgi:hypothetical protein